MIATACALAVSASACVRPSPPPSGQSQAGSPVAATPAAPRTVPGTAPPEANVVTPAPVTLKPAAKPETPAAKASPASSLGGHDRHLVLKPLEPVLAADFELGALAAMRADSALGAAIDALEGGLVSAKLPYEIFSDKAAAIASVVYPESALQGITAARFSAPRIDAGSVASIGIRVFARRDDEAGVSSVMERSVKSAATGLVILTQKDTGTWRVDHFELDLESLARPMGRPEMWDPYSSAIRY